MDRAGLSQAELAKRLGTPKSTVNNWFTTSSRPYPDLFDRLQVVLGVSADYLLGRTPTGRTIEAADRAQTSSVMSKENGGPQPIPAAPASRGGGGAVAVPPDSSEDDAFWRKAAIDLIEAFRNREVHDAHARILDAETRLRDAETRKAAEENMRMALVRAGLPDAELRKAASGDPGPRPSGRPGG